MRVYIKSILLGLIVCLMSCEDVIDVTVPTAKPRLVVDAALDWQKGTSGNNQVVKLSLSSPYFDTTTDMSVLGASVKVVNMDSGVEYVFTDQNNGEYITSSFEPIINNTYQLEIQYNNETYTATEKMISVPPINRFEQSLEGGEDAELLDISIYWNDPIDEENFYLVKLIEEGVLLPVYEDEDDEFSNGNELDEIFEKEKDEDDESKMKEFNIGDQVEITLYGVSERHKNYMQLLIEQSDSDGDPFSAIPVKLKGNCINIDVPENYAFGYFRLSEFDRINHTFE